MPLVHDTPKIAQVPSKDLVEVQVTETRLLSAAITFGPRPTVAVEHAEGYVENGEFIPVSFQTDRFAPGEIDIAALEKALEAALLVPLVDSGKAPPGEVKDVGLVEIDVG